MRLFCGGGSRGRARAGSPSCLDQTAARRAPKKFLNPPPPPPPLISGSRWPPPPLPLSGGLDSPLFCTSYSYPGFYFFRLSTMATGSHGRPISFMPTTLPGSPAAATILTGPSSATGPGNFDSFTAKAFYQHFAGTVLFLYINGYLHSAPYKVTPKLVLTLKKLT